MLTIVELAALTGLSYQKLYRLIRAHQIKPQGYNWKQRYYPAREVLRHVDGWTLDSKPSPSENSRHLNRPQNQVDSAPASAPAWWALSRQEVRNTL